jgi:hypothetical protein
MLEEICKIDISLGDGNLISSELYLYNEDPINNEHVKIELHYLDKVVECSSENYFDALVKLRRILEKDNMQILCKGANKDVYPSAMQLNMGYGRQAYKLTMHQQAKLKDVVDIFDSSSVTDCVSIDEQKRYFDLWTESLG